MPPRRRSERPPAGHREGPRTPPRSAARSRAPPSSWRSPATRASTSPRRQATRRPTASTGRRSSRPPRSTSVVVLRRRSTHRDRAPPTRGDASGADRPRPVAAGASRRRRPTRRVPLGCVFGARSGDKGGNANLGVWARSDAGYAWLGGLLTADRLQPLLPETAASRSAATSCPTCAPSTSWSSACSAKASPRPPARPAGQGAGRAAAPTHCGHTRSAALTPDWRAPRRTRYGRAGSGQGQRCRCMSDGPFLRPHARRHASLLRLARR